MHNDILPLAAAFPPTGHGDWLALVEKTLKGAGVDTLRGATADGLVIEPLYVDGPCADFIPAGRTGERPWDIRASIIHPDPANANDQALENLTGGASSLLLRLDPTGKTGVAIGSADDLARSLRDVLTDLAPVALDAGFMGPASADWLATVAKASPVAPLAFHLDPLAAFARTGVSPGPIEAHVIAAAQVAARLAEPCPKASAFLANGQVVHEAGGTPAWELAFVAAAALSYAKAMVRAGLPLEDAFARIVLCLSVDADAPASLGKLRAARVIWGKITAACGIHVPAQIEARSSGRMLTRVDPWTNLVRLTSAGFAAAVGGADTVVLGAFTDALGLPGNMARRLARNTQLILMEEARVGAVADPAAGAWALETQTLDLARCAWLHFQEIEAAGGLVEALRSDLISRAVASARADLQEAIRTKAIRILGVTDFPDARPTPPALEEAGASPTTAPDPRLPGPDSRCAPLIFFRLEELAA